MRAGSWRRALLASLLGCFAAMGQAAAQSDPHAMPMAAPSAPAPTDAASSAIQVDPVAPNVASPTCSSVTDRAMAVDLSAANAQAQRATVAEQARLLDESTGLWRQAVTLCTGRARERAERNLKDSQKARTAIGALQGAGEGCLASQKDAATLEELASRLMGERRFSEGAGLFRRAESQWDLAAERCSGAQQQQAQQRREKAEIDAHNAEHCAPLFQAAMEFTQRLRNSAAALSPTERQNQSLVAETLWRDAIPKCKSAALDLARSQAQTQARERGTPWVDTRPAPAPRAGGAPAAASTAVATATAPSAAPARNAGGGAVRAPVGPRQMDELLGGGTRLVGVFAPDAGSGAVTYTGQGKILWANGEVYDGAVVRGKRQGVGEFVWVTGQRYRGDWVDDRPEGQGHMRFANGNLYEGQVQDGQPQGTGRMIYASGDVYKGEMQRGEPHGQGEYLWINGQRYEGPWHQGKAGGKGALTFTNGNHFEGDVVDGVPHGTGRMRYASGEVYQGRFAKGVPDGEGSYQWKNGDRYVGQWRNGTKDGRGTLQWANGDRWEGVFRADAQTEQGTLTRGKKP